MWLGRIGLVGILVSAGLGPLSASAAGEGGLAAVANGTGATVASQPVPSIGPDAAASGGPMPASLQLAQASNGAGSRIFVVQLASVTSQQEAEREWDQLKESFPDLLDGNQLLVERVELGGRGTFHRVQTGPFPDLQMAERLCDQLKERSQDCLVMQISMSYPTPPAPVPAPAAEARQDSDVGQEVPPAGVAGSEELFEQFLKWRKERGAKSPSE